MYRNGEMFSFDLKMGGISLIPEGSLLQSAKLEDETFPEEVTVVLPVTMQLVCTMTATLLEPVFLQLTPGISSVRNNRFGHSLWTEV